ncbi:hypothetical protein ACSQ67_022176 [Phaseolus vulgaris]
MQIETRPAYEYDENLPNSEMMMMTSFASTSPPTLGYIAVSKLDTLAGIAIKYGVEMFALNTLHIPLNGKHPPPNSSEQDDTEESPADNTRAALEAGNGGFSTRSTNGLAQRQKSANRIAFTPCSKQVV